MKTRTYSILLIFLLSLVFTSCIDDDILYDEDPRDKFLGVWKVSEDCIRLNYDVNIKYDPGNSAQVLIENFANPGPGSDPVTGLVVEDKIFIDQQVIGDDWTVTGDGILVEGQVEWEYILIIGGNQIDCTAVYSR